MGIENRRPTQAFERYHFSDLKPPAG